MINYVLKVLATIFGIFFYGKIQGRREERRKTSDLIIEDFYDAKKRQEEYDDVPVDDKRKWLRNYSKKVSSVAKTDSKKRRAF